MSNKKITSEFIVFLSCLAEFTQKWISKNTRARALYNQLNKINLIEFLIVFNLHC